MMTILSAPLMVESLFAMMMDVLPFMTSSSPSWMRYSVSVSTLDVASSRIRILGSTNKALARAILALAARSPMPRSPTGVS